ncbi:MAG: 2-oxo acid dehydrogenase subunit E2, partial [Pseudomonadota bacterium]|nr:2-oxo acid dehydrogenase subunit E2 [Pseudomonadota bacterium]
MTTTIEVIVPDIGDFSEVEIIEIHVGAGDRVNAEDPLITLESDKATMDIPSPADGTVKKIGVGVGDKVSEGSLVLTMEAASAALPARQTEKPETLEKPVAETADEAPLSEAPTDTPKAEPPQAEREQAFREKPYSPPPTLPPPVERARTALPHASPSVRRFARELGADLARVRGSGPKERVLKEDVKAWVKQRLGTGAAPEAAAGMGIPPLPEIDFSKFGPIEVQALPRIKKISGPHLRRAWLNVPHVTHHDEADITDLEAFRKTLKNETAQQGIRVTLLSFVMQAVIAALKKYPQFNASLSTDGENLIFKQYYHLGIAVD